MATIRGHMSNGRWIKTRTYKIWEGMIARCTQPSDGNYKFYGAKGVTVSDDWRDFAKFFADMGERPEGKSLDRIDNSKGYSKENCRWATPKEQADNRKRAIFLEHDGRKQSLADWSRETGIPRGTLHNRVKMYGWSIARALTTPVQGV